MILKSLIKDESKVSFDCAKATIGRGDVITIDDCYYRSTEIQNAIKLGFCQIEGQIPIFPEEPLNLNREQKIKFRNNFNTKLCFECIKDYAEPGAFIYVPVEKIDTLEIRNAIVSGWLVNEDNPEMNPTQYNTGSVHLEELKVSDLIIDTRSSMGTVDGETLNDLAGVMSKPRVDAPLPAGVPATRPARKSAKKAEAAPIKAKAISRSDESDGMDDSGGSDLYKPTELHMPKAPKTAKPVKEALSEAEVDDVLDDIFSKGK